MARLGLLEGRRVRTLGAPFMTPDAFKGPLGPHSQFAMMTTDWPALYNVDPVSARQKYLDAAYGTVDPEAWPTVESFMTAHGMAFTTRKNRLPRHAIGPNAVFNNGEDVPAASFQPDPAPAMPDAYYNPAMDSQAAAAANLDFATLSRDPVTGPSFQPDPAPSSTNVTVPPVVPDGNGVAVAAPATSNLVPIALAIAAYMVIK